MTACPTCDGEGRVYETRAIWDAQQQQVYPDEVAHVCPECGGSGEEPGAFR